MWTPGLSRRWRRVAYLSLLRARLCYGNVVFAAASNRQLKRISVFQNNCLRAMTNTRLRDRVPIQELQRRTSVESIPTFFANCQRRSVSSAVKFILPIREDIEDVRNNNLTRGPMVALNNRLHQQPLPPMVI